MVSGPHVLNRSVFPFDLQTLMPPGSLIVLSLPDLLGFGFFSKKFGNPFGQICQVHDQSDLGGAFVQICTSQKDLLFQLLVELGWCRR
ncbi:hypothetical protein Dimus_025794 [Dionaea muscipula]